MKCPLLINQYGSATRCEKEECALAAEFTYLIKGEKTATERRCLIAEALKKYVREE